MERPLLRSLDPYREPTLASLLVMDLPVASRAWKTVRTYEGHPRAFRRRREVIWAYVLMAPALALVLGGLGYPLAWEVWVSLTDFGSTVTGRPTFVGLANYQRMVESSEFWRGMLTTVLYFATTTVAKLALGIAMALALAVPYRGRALVFLAIFLPWAYPGGVTVIGWYWMLNPPLTTSYSIAAGNMKLIVDAHAGSGAYAFLSVVLFNIWRGGSFTAVFLLAGLNAIPSELFEYARLETRSAWQRFWLVTLPLLRPYVALAVFLSFTMAFADLANVWMLTGGRIIFPLVGTYAYWLAIKSGRLAEGAAYSLSLVPLLGLALWALFRWFDPAEKRRA
jgi:multiple sugar transport system permease protein